MVLLSLMPPPVELAEVHARASLRAASPAPPPPSAAGQAVSALPARYLLHACATAAAGEGKDIELRHQRNPDVTFDCLVDPAGVPAQLACLGMGDALWHSRVSSSCPRLCPALLNGLSSSSCKVCLPSWGPAAAVQLRGGACPTKRLWRLRRCCPPARGSFWSCGRRGGCAAPAGRMWRRWGRAAPDRRRPRGCAGAHQPPHVPTLPHCKRSLLEVCGGASRTSREEGRGKDAGQRKELGRYNQQAVARDRQPWQSNSV